MGVLRATLGGLPGYRLARVLGVAKGSAVRAKHLGKDLEGGLRKPVGGEVPKYMEMPQEACRVRNAGCWRSIWDRSPKEEAKRLGTGAVLGARYTAAHVFHGAAEILVYGTAVRLKPTKEPR
ncbi:YbjQ family protein [Thermus albus]|uniref:YbjQ family protein n=1 Tax=Thermus albus TaxID=2908146 RepID=UPI001FA97598|nr:heavy metal-binding domain-containing protein [Thermus albus]